MRGILSFIFVIGTGIMIHEMGHFFAARFFGVMRHEFSIGMGPKIWKRRRGETLFTLRAIPIGGAVTLATSENERGILRVGTEVGIRLNARGYVERIYFNPVREAGVIIGKVTAVDLYHQLTLTLDGVRMYSVERNAMYEDLKANITQYIAPYERCLDSKSKFARLLTMSAGAMMNFILAFAFVLVAGLIQGEPFATNELAVVEVGMAAHQAGLVVGDQIIEYNGFVISTGEELITAIRSTTETTSVTFIRAGDTHQISLTPSVVETNEGRISQIGILTNTTYSFSLRYAVDFAMNQLKNGFSLILRSVEMLFVTHEAGVQDLSGPVGVAMMASQVAAQGILPLFILASVINVNLGVMNLLPLPALDGGRIAFILMEMVMGRPVNQKFETITHTIGFFLLMGLFIFIFFNDVYRISVHFH